MKTLDFHSFMFFCCLCLEGWDKKERQRWGQAENDIEDLLNEEILGFQQNIRISRPAMFFSQKKTAVSIVDIEEVYPFMLSV